MLISELSVVPLSLYLSIYLSIFLLSVRFNFHRVYPALLYWRIYGARYFDEIRQQRFISYKASRSRTRDFPKAKNTRDVGEECLEKFVANETLHVLTHRWTRRIIGDIKGKPSMSKGLKVRRRRRQPKESPSGYSFNKFSLSRRSASMFRWTSI